MTSSPTAPAREALAEALRQSLDALRALGSLAVQLGEQTTLTSRYVLTANSVAEVDGVAADMEVRPRWTMPWSYSATWTEGTVTVTVAFHADPPQAPADASSIEMPTASTTGGAA